MQPAIERRRAQRLRVVTWIAVAGAVIFIAGGALFVGGISLDLRRSFANAGSAPLIGMLMGGLGLLFVLGGLGMLLGSLISWCLVRKPQFRLRTCFVACLILAVLLACMPRIGRLAAEAGIRITADEVTIERKGDGRAASPYSIEMTFPLNPMWLVPVLLPALSVMLLVSRVYRR